MEDIHPNFMLCGTCHVLCEDEPSFATRSAGTGCEKHLFVA